jgi:hypothetical protein
MSLGLGIGLWPGHNPALSGGGGGAFTPASLSPRLWVENDPATVFSDGGVTPSANNAVGRQWNDKSGNGINLDWGFNSGDSTTLPLWRNPGGTKPYLEFDGTNDTLMSGTVGGFTDGSGQHWLAISCYVNSNAVDRYFTHINGSGAVSAGRIASAAGRADATNSSGTGFADAGPSIASATWIVLIYTIAGTTVECFVDNASNGSSSITGALATDATARLFVGSQQAAFNFLAGRVCGVVAGTGVLSPTNRGLLQTYMAALHP